MTDGRALIPITRPYITEDEAQAAAEVMRAGWLLQGPRVAAFEEALAYYVGARHAIATSNATMALRLALAAWEIGPGDEVIVPACAWIAAANVVVQTGATPVFVDVEPHTCTVDPASVEAAVTPHTRAMIPIAQHGLPANLPTLLPLAARYGLYVLEDAASALGATVQGRRVGSISPVTCFSFHAYTSITTCDGGMITTDDSALAARLRPLRAHGASLTDSIRLHTASLPAETYELPGYDCGMTDMQAAVGLVQIKKIDWILERRRTLGERYTRLLAALPGLTVPHVPSGMSHSYQAYPVRLDPAVWPDRETVMEQLLARGIGSRRGACAVHLEPYYRQRYGRVHLPVAEEVARRTMLLPLYTAMTMLEQDAVLEALRAIVLRTAPSPAPRVPAPPPAARRPTLALLHGSRPARGT